MKTRAAEGSITVFLSLCSLVFLSLFAAAFSSVSTAAGRAMAAGALDQAVYSLLSRYDRDLWESFGIFALPGEESSPAFGRFLSDVRENSEILLHTHTWAGGASWPDLAMEDLAVTQAGTLCAENGDAFLRQAVEYTEDTLGIAAVRALSGSLTSDVSSLPSLEQAAEDAVSEETDTLLREIENAGSAALPEGADGTAQGPAVPPDGEDAPAVSGAEAKRRLGTLRHVRASSLLTFAVPDPDAVSGNSLPDDFTPSVLAPFPPLGLTRLAGSTESGTDRLLLTEYLLTHFSSFRKPTETASLSYQTEYLLFGKDNDTENLSECVRALHRLRCGAAMITFLSDSGTLEEASSTAKALCTAAGVPELAPAVSAALLGALAWTQGALDVRALLRGYRIPLLHREGTALTFEKLPLVLASPDVLLRDDPSGSDYTAYLRILLYTCRYPDLRERVLSMAEDTVRIRYDRPGFCLSGCVDTVELSMNVHIEELLHATVVKRLSYRRNA